MKNRYLLILLLIVGLKGYSQNVEPEGNAITVEPLNINTAQSEMGPSIIGKELLFSSVERDTTSKKEGEAFYDLFTVGLNDDGTVQAGERKKSTLKSEFHKGPSSFCAKTGELFLTQSDWQNAQSKNVIFKKKDVRLGIVIYRKANKTWRLKTTFPYNSSEYSVGHPAINSRGDTLVFVSDMPGGVGASDLYYSAKVRNHWTKPVNLGSKVNTTGKEITPFLDNKGKLIFASERSGGKGFDLYYVDFPVTEDSKVHRFYGAINSDADDFGLVIGTNQQTGYFVSNREGGKGDDDIYAVTGFILDVFIKSSVNDNVVEDAEVSLVDGSGTEVFHSETDSTGKVSASLKFGQKYTLNASKGDGYEKNTFDLDLSGETLYTAKYITITLDPLAKPAPIQPTNVSNEVVQIISSDSLVRDTVIVATVVDEPQRDSLKEDVPDTIVVERLQPVSSETIYKVQIGQFPQNAIQRANEKFKTLAMLRRIDHYTAENGMECYTVGSLTSLDDAQRLQKQVQQEGIRDAIVVAFKDGKRVSLPQSETKK
jgi:hypothetical protein